MAYDYRKLSGKIVEVFGTQAKFAEAMEKSERTISLKINGKIDWTQEEMIKAAQLLRFDVTDIPSYFFNYKVQD